MKMNKWIKCSDQMPDMDGRYLVYEKHFKTSEFGWVGVASMRNGKWDSPSIKAWQPLPKPPGDDE